MTDSHDADSVRELFAPEGVLHAAINIGNPVLAGGTASDPTGVTVDLAREIARRLDATPAFHVFTAAKDSFASLVLGESALAFLAIEPARATEVVFTAPYVLIEGVYVVPEASAIRSVADADAAGVRIGVKEGSAYDLFLTRTVQNAVLVRGAEGVDVFVDEGLEAGAGIRQPVEAFVAAHPGHRVIDEAFMQIRQALALPITAPAEAVAWTEDLLDELKSSGFIREAMVRSGRGDVTLAPPR